MKNSVKIIFTFVLGAAVGTVATYKFFKTKYEAIAQEEIDSVKEVYAKRKSVEEKAINTINNCINREKEEYGRILNKNNYSNENERKGGSEKSMENMKPRIIHPDEFGDNDDYETISLICFEDGVITDDQEVPIEDVENTVGPDIDYHYGEYEDDTVYVINDRLKCYFEVCRDYRNYSDLSGVDE